MAEEPFTSTTGGQMPAGSLIFDAAAETALEAAGDSAGFFFERGVGAKPATTQLDEAPRVAILVDSRGPAENDTSVGTGGSPRTRSREGTRSVSGP